RRILGAKRFRTRSAASKAEWRVKQLGREAKLALAEAPQQAPPLALLALASPAEAASAPKGVVRVAPGFRAELARALNARAYTVVTDPVVKSDDFPGFLDRYVQPGELAILTGGFLRGGFELWEKGGREPLLARWRWFARTAEVIREE